MAVRRTSHGDPQARKQQVFAVGGPGTELCMAIDTRTLDHLSWLQHGVLAR